MNRFVNSVKGRVLIAVLVFMVICIPAIFTSYSAPGGFVEEPTDKPAPDIISAGLKDNVQVLFEELLVTNYGTIDSNIYLVTDKYIERIEPNTDISEFSKKFNRTDFIITLDGEVINEGIVKTGMVLTVNDISYTLVVKGDVSKDGLLNYVDTSMIINNSKTKELDELSLLASDINEDGIVNRDDVLCSIEYIFNGTLDIKEINKVTAPTLEIVEGTKGSGNWYQGNVTVKFNSNGVEYGAYRIVGSKDETIYNVEDGTLINLRGGAYKIIAWNYAEDGNRSSSVSTVLKIDEVNQFRCTMEEDRLYLREYLGPVDENTDFVVPATYYGYPVYGVGHDDAMVDFDSEILVLTNIVGKTLDLEKEPLLSATVVNTLSIEEGIVEIGISAFSGFISKEGDFTIPDSVKSIGAGAFVYSCPGFNADIEKTKGTLHIGTGVEKIGLVAFAGMISGGDIVIPDNVKEMEFGAFTESYINGELYLGSGLSILEDDSFSYATIRNIHFAENGKLTTFGEYAFYDVNLLEGDFVIPDSVTTLDMDALYSLKVPGDLVLGNGVKKIGKDRLTHVEVGGDVIFKNVETIEEYAFEMATVKGNIDLGNNLKYVGTGAFYNTVMEQGDFVIPGSLESIGPYAFQHFFASNSRLILSEGLVNIQNSAFQKSIFDGDLVIPNSVVVIGDKAFEGASIRGNLVLGNSVSSIGNDAFEKGIFTGDLIIPSSVKSIGKYAFNDNQFNGELKYDGVLSNVGDYAFANNISLTGTIEVDSTVPLNIVAGTSVVLITK